jgi:hypothetical protein
MSEPVLDDEAKAKKTVYAKVASLRGFVKHYQSQERLIEVYNSGGVYAVLDKEVAAAKVNYDYYKRIYDEKLDKRKRKDEEISLVKKWLEENRPKYDELQGMLSDDVEALLKKLEKLV